MALPSVLVEEVSQLVNGITGIQLGKKQAAMVESRLTRRMIQLGFQTPDEYLSHIKENRESEITALVSLLTTHHTNFFREFSHFEYLEHTGLQALITSLRQRKEKVLRVWSAACSRGHEVYSLSMFLSVHLKRLAPEMTFEILGSDVDSQSIEIAKNGVYRWNEIKSIPSIYLDKNWVRGTGEISEFVKAKPVIKAPCKFETINLLDFSKQLSGRTFDLIFCRNVFIYFTLEQVRSITENLMKNLAQDGILFIGISESLNGITAPVTYLAPSVYGHKRMTASKVHPAVFTPTLPLRPVPTQTVFTAPVAQTPVRVFSIDDSPTILSLLKKILTKEMGFELVGTAENGVDAAQKLKSVTADVVTLDIHMPVQNGIEYLQKNRGSMHPPVVMLTSVSREDVELGLKSLELGAVDYVEKPSLSDLAKRADEIRTKLRCAALSMKGGVRGVLEVERAFERTFRITSPERKMRVVFAGIGDREKLVSVLRSLKAPQPPTAVFIQGAEVLLEGLAASLSAGSGLSVSVMKSGEALQPGRVYLANCSGYEEFKEAHFEKRTSILVFGDVSGEVIPKILSWTKAHVIAEDLNLILSEQHRALLTSAQKVVPYTSFAYHSDECLSVEERRTD